MVKAKNNLSRRFLATVLSILMVLSTIPFSMTPVLAATDENPDAGVTVTVKDENGNPVKDANVEFSIDSKVNGDSWKTGTVQTDEFGCAEVLSTADYGTATVDDLTVTATVSKDGFVTDSTTIAAAVIISDKQNFDVALVSTAITDVKIEGKTLTYNGGAQELVSVTEVNGDTVDYGTLPDGVTLNDAGKPVATNAGTYNITVTVSRDGNKHLEKTVTGKIEPAVISDISIEKVENLKYNGEEQELAVLNGSFLPDDTVTWTVNGTDTGSKDIPKRDAVGIYTVKLTVERANYSILEQEVSVEIALGEISIGNLKISGNDLTYNGTAQQAISIANYNADEYKLKYQISNKNDDTITQAKDLDNTKWLDLNPEGSMPMVTDAGQYIVWVKAIKTEDYEDQGIDVGKAENATFPFNVYVAKADQTLNFEVSQPESVGITNNELVAGKTYNFKAIDYEKLANGTVTYAVDVDPDIAVIDKNGLLTVKNAGEIKVTATLSGNENYNEVTISHTLKINVVAHTPGELISFKDKENIKEYIIGDIDGVPEKKADKTNNLDLGIVTYSITNGTNYGLEINKISGKIAVTDYNKLISAVAAAGGTLNVTVRADKASTLFFEENYDTYILPIKFLSTPDAPYSLSDVDGTNGWYKTKATVIAAEGYTLAKTAVNTEADNFNTSVEFDNQGTETRYIYLKETETGRITNAIPVDIKIDSIAPDANNMTVDIQDLNIIEKIGYKFGFFNPEVEIKFTVADETETNESGMQKFTWYYSNDAKAAASVVADKLGELTPVLEDGKYTATLKIKASELETYRGNISFTATDKAGNVSAEKHDNDNVIVVVDKINPVMSADFKLADANGKYNPIDTNGTVQHYYNGSVKFTFTIKEQNFFSEDVIVNVSKDGAEAQVVTLEWTDGDNDNHYGEFILSGDGDYVVTMSYKDQSKNVMVDESGNEVALYTSEVITIDTKHPVITVEHDERPAVQKTTITVVEHNFRAEDVDLVLTAKDINGVPFNAKDLAAELAKPENWKQDTENTDKYIFENTDYLNGIYELELNYTDISGNEAEKAIKTFTVDHGAPTDVKIEYSKSIIDTVLETATLGFYNPSVEVTFTATDLTSGVDSFTWSYDRTNGASGSNVEKLTGVVEKEQIKANGSTFTATITLPKEVTGDETQEQLHGNMTVSATDTFKNNSNKIRDDGYTFVVDTISPKMTAEYSKESGMVGTTAYYNGDATVTFTVNEANFFSEDVIVSVSKDGAEPVQITPEWKDESVDVHIGTYTLSGDGDYIVYVKYHDRSQNDLEIENGLSTSTTYQETEKKYVEYKSHTITIDTVKPVINVEYQNTNLIDTIKDRDGNDRKYFDNTQTAKITIDEHNFAADEVGFTIVAKDVTGKELDVSALNAKSEWSVGENDDIHIITITYPGDANYTFDVAYTDLATNEADDYAPDYFTVDKTAPTDLSVSYSTSVLDTVLESLTFGFYNAKMTVNLTAEDATSEIHSFLYSYLNAAGVSSVNAELVNQAIEAADIKYSEDRATASVTFEIPKMVLQNDNQFNGTVEFTATDRSGNVSDAHKETKRIVVDNIAPTAQVSYNEATNVVGDIYYFNGDINATVTINEANFYANDVQVMVSKDGATATAVTPNWTDSNVDVHVGTFTLTEDGDYVVTINYKDKSSNTMTAYTSKQMTIDTKIEAPTYSINGVAKTEIGGAYKNDAVVGFSFDDQNFATKTIKLTRTRFDKVEDVTNDFVRVTDDIRGGSGSFAIPSKVENDGIYVLEIGMTDKANHTTESQIKFTINRFGSVYEYSDYLVSLIKDGGQYIKIDGNNQSAITQDLVITEYNANQILAGSLNILITRDGETVDAKYSTNPAIDNNAGIGESGWYQYDYTIAKENFAEDGVYKITLTSAYTANDSDRNESTSVPENSVDTAGNQILDTMNFTVDTKKPEIRNIVGLDKSIVNAQTIDVKYTIVDVGGLKSVEVVVNGQTVDTITDFGGSVFNYSGQFTINESSNEQTVQIKAIDIAGNVTDTAAEDFSTNDLYIFNDTITVSTNIFVRWYANKPLFWGSIGGVVVLTGAIWFLVAFKRKKKEDKEEK